jgi:hypothetical protein
MTEVAQAKLKEEQGMVLVVALFIMVVMALIGAAAMMVSSVDMGSSREDRLRRAAFFSAEGGIEMVPSILDYFIRNTPDPAGFPGNLRSDLQGMVQDGDFLNEIMGYDTNNDGSTDNPNNNPDVQMTTVDGRQVTLDIDRFFTEHAGGGSAESLVGYEGVGTSGGTGGTAVYYRATSRAADANNTVSNVEIVYRYIY